MGDYQRNKIMAELNYLLISRRTNLIYRVLRIIEQKNIISIDNLVEK